MIDEYEAGGYNDYQRFDQNNHYTYDSGLVALPVAGPTPAVRVIRLHGGYGTRTLNYAMARDGRPPVIPAMIDTPNDTFLSGDVAFGLPGSGQTSQGYNWSVTGEYTFIQLTPRIVGENTFPVGVYPGAQVTQDLGADGQGGADTVPPYESMTLPEWEAFWTPIASAAEANPLNSDWTWPYLAFPPIYSSSLPLAN